MNVNVVCLFGTAPRNRDWSNQELAEFYRVENSLIRAGLPVETDRGLSDEGDPWFVFCHAETGDIIIHFARFDGSYAVASSAFDRCMRGADFRSLIEALIATHPLAIAKANGAAKISIHPAALMVAVVMTCFFKLAQTQAFASQLCAGEAQTDPASGADHDAAAKSGSVMVDDRHSQMLLTAIAFAVTWADPGAVDSTLFAGPGALDVVQPMIFTPNSEHADAGLNPLNNSGLAFEHLGQPADHAQPVLGVLPFGDVAAAPSGDWGHFHAMLQTPSIVAFDSAPFDTAPISSIHESNTAKVAESADQSVQNLVWLPAKVNVALGAGGAIGTSSPPATTNTPQSLQEVNNVLGNQISLQEVNNVLGNQISTHQILDFSGAQPQLVLSLVENERVAPAQQEAAHSGAPNQGIAGAPNPTGYAALLNSGSIPTTATISETSVNSSAKLAAFDNAVNSFTSAHPDFHILELPNDVVVFDTHLNPGNVGHASVAIWTFVDGSQVTLVGVAPHATPLG
jgi:hypothetical protein